MIIMIVPLCIGNVFEFFKRVVGLKQNGLVFMLIGHTFVFEKRKNLTQLLLNFHVFFVNVKA